MYLSKNLRLAYLVLTALLHLCIAGVLFTADMERSSRQEATSGENIDARRIPVGFLLTGGASGAMAPSGTPSESDSPDVRSDNAGSGWDTDNGVRDVSVRKKRDDCDTCGNAAVGTEDVGHVSEKDDGGNGTAGSGSSSLTDRVSDEKPEKTMDVAAAVFSEVPEATLKEAATSSSGNRSEIVHSIQKKEKESQPAPHGPKPRQRTSGTNPGKANQAKHSDAGKKTTAGAESGMSARAPSGGETDPRASASGGHGDPAQASGAGSSGILELSQARLLYRPEFVYPASARRFGRQGLVKLVLTVSSSGEVRDVRVEKTSGHSSLDDSAVKYASKFRFASGAGGGFLVRVPVLYQLK